MGCAASARQTSVIGSATARTPLLDRPLSGKVYFVKGVRTDPKTGRQIKTLPTLLVQLRGDIALDLRATTAVDAKSRLVTTFAPIPDAAVSSFRLTLAGGKHGILAVTSRDGICTGAQKAALVATGHNGKRAPSTVTLGTPCSAAPKLSGVRALSGGRVRVAVKATAAGRVVLRGAERAAGLVVARDAQGPDAARDAQAVEEDADVAGPRTARERARQREVHRQAQGPGDGAQQGGAAAALRR